MAQLTLPEIIQLATDQFQVQNASDCITAVRQLNDVFSPPHHGPRNIPITASNVVLGSENFTHFPIVYTSPYYIFVATEGVFVEEMIYGPPGNFMPIPVRPIPLPKSSPFFMAYESISCINFTINDPEPIAIHFGVESLNSEESVQYIVVSQSHCEAINCG